MLTNFKTVKVSIKRLKDMEAMVEDGSIERLSKKEALMASASWKSCRRALAASKELGGLPDALFVIDVGYHKIAITEANKLGIPVVGVVDTNHSPEGVDFVIPGNDGSSRAIPPVRPRRCRRRARRQRIRSSRKSWAPVPTSSSKWKNGPKSRPDPAGRRRPRPASTE